MARMDVNRSGELEVFVRVVELGGLSAAARACRMTPSAVSKLVARLEARLGARLINRSTRALQLTPEGCLYYERGVRILADLDEAERGAAATEIASGRLRINSNVPFGRHFLLPLAPDFLALHPQVSLDIMLTDQVVDLLEDRTDVAVRAGPLRSSGLMARKLGETGKHIVAAPTYLARHGMPRSVAELERHNRIGLGYARTVEGWPLVENGAPLSLPVIGSIQVSDGDALRHAALAGLGLARLTSFQVRADIAAGRLVPVMEAFNPGDIEPVHALFLGQGGPLPARVRAFLDFLVARVGWNLDCPESLT